MKKPTFPLGSTFVQAALVFVVVLLAGLLIWFVGPQLAVDGHRPLASAGARVIAIAMLLLLAMLKLTGGPILLAALAAGCLIVWELGPLLSFGATQPLASLSSRVLCIAVLALPFAFYWFYRLMRLFAEPPEHLRKWLTFGVHDKESAELQRALRPLRGKIEEAVAQLKLLQGGGFWRRACEKNHHLYALPWFMLVGGPASGKTAALRQCGLQFPLAQREEGPQAFGATANFDWSIANEAVLIDTGGRYFGPETREAVATDKPSTHAEWRGLLGLLRKHRPRAPVNGVILTMSAAELLDPDASRRSLHTAVLRERLAEMRRSLGIRFPVYFVVTKTDLLRGFGPFFQSLTSEGRTQIWGFNLAADGRGKANAAGLADTTAYRESLRQQVAVELGLLAARLEAGLRLRLKEEFEVDRRRALFALPLEMAALAEPLAQAIDEIFLDSRFDDTQAHHALRGIYFTSAEQHPGQHLAADRQTLMAQLSGMAGDTGLPEPKAGAGDGRSGSARERQGFFLHDLLSRIVIPQAHLVRPNLRWELRFRLLRMLGHGIALLLFAWMVTALTTSWRYNRHYLDVVDTHAAGLRDKVSQLLAHPRQANVAAVLDAARLLPSHAGFDGAAAAHRWSYGLNAAPAVVSESAAIYARLQETTLLPTILRRMESRLSAALREADATQAYATLRAYKLLHDSKRYMAEGGADDVRAWVLEDAARLQQEVEPAFVPAAASHIESLFSGAGPVQAATLPNEALVREVQRFLEADTSSQRVYKRAKAALSKDAPADFTLVRAVGPQVGTVFSREGDQPLEAGVPGLFTREGYHGLFSKRLGSFVAQAAADDAWVMGHGSSEQSPRAEPGATALAEDVRRQYLQEYAGHWAEFLDSVRSVAAPAADGESLGVVAGAAASTGMGFDLGVLRQLAAPDSPLTRLARAVVVQTTLAQTLPTQEGGERGGLLDLIGIPLDAAAPKKPAAFTGVDQARRLEREIVDQRFAALRELVTGQADTQHDLVTPAAARPGLEALAAVINEFYTQLVVADTALGTGGLPPGAADVGARLALEAAKLPAPLRQVLLAQARSGSDKVAQGTGTILRRQAQVQFDRLLGLMAQTVGEPCRRGIEGRYPFADSNQDASIEDVIQVFAVGGASDEFFSHYLAPFVDTSVRPWRYRAAGAPPLATAIDTLAGVAASPVASNGPTLLGELLKLLVQGGPRLDSFYRAQQIRELFFREGAGKRLSWKMDLAVLELDPTITDLLIDIDGQGQRYVHGPVQPLRVEWPGPRGGSMASMSANPRISGATSSLLVNGPWALLHLLDKGRVFNSATAGRVSVELGFDGRKALIGISAGSLPNPLNSDLLRGYRCPGLASAV